jgi:CheY-like chemotaxis protein
MLAHLFRLDYKQYSNEALQRSLRKLGCNTFWVFWDYLLYEETDLKHSILVVDDEVMTRDLIRMMLERVGFSVREAEDGVDALRKLEDDGSPDVFILDVMMPNMDGYTLCRELRKRLDTAHLPVIMLSAKTQDTAVQEGYAAGATKYLTKPISRIDLIDNLKEVLGIS